MEALREAQVVSSAESPQPAPPRQREKKGERSPKKRTGGLLKSAEHLIDEGSTVSLSDAKKAPGARGKGGRIFTPLEVEEAEVIIIRRR
jgi:hypothetical protein